MLRELKVTEQEAVARIADAMTPILEDIVDEKGATLLLDRTVFMFGDEGNDVTSIVVDTLNEELDDGRLEDL